MVRGSDGCRWWGRLCPARLQAFPRRPHPSPCPGRRVRANPIPYDSCAISLGPCRAASPPGSVLLRRSTSVTCLRETPMRRSAVRATVWCWESGSSRTGPVFLESFEGSFQLRSGGPFRLPGTLCPSSNLHCSMDRCSPSGSPEQSAACPSGCVVRCPDIHPSTGYVPRASCPAPFGRS